MAFYGRITNNQANTSMTFDKVYPNRVAMDNAASADGVFTGRFVLIEYGSDTEEYSANYQADKEKYPNLGRGYDSTVWRKVIANDGTGYYVMLAELNSVVPSFTVEGEAPSTIPTAPHFDEDSTNVLYNLHVGSPWGFKIKAANTTANESDAPGTLDSDDFATAIYINKAGFDKTTIHANDEGDHENNFISITPTGYSGQKYYDHNTKVQKAAPDQQEMVIHLPSIGDAVAEMWDRLYGGSAAYKSQDSSLTDDEDISRVTEIGWRNANDPKRYAGLRLIDGRYTPEQIDNVAGALNSVYDLIGQNIQPISFELEEGETVEDKLQELAPITNENTIYYCINDNKFYFKNYEVTIEPLDPAQVADLDIIQKGSNPEEVVGTILNPAGKILYTRPTEAEHYIAVQEDEDLQPEVEYYTLDSNVLSALSESEVETTDEDFATLRDKGILYKYEHTNAADYLRLVSEDAAYDSTQTYYILESKEPNSILKYFPTKQTSPFVTYDNKTFDTYPSTTFTGADQLTQEGLVNLAKGHIFFERIATGSTHPTNPDGSIDYSQTIYTQTLSIVAISRELANYITANYSFIDVLKNGGFDVTGKPTIDKWPNSTVEFTGVWLKTDDDYYITKNAPVCSSNSTVYINPSINGVATVLSGVQTYNLTPVEIKEFYKANTAYWGTIDDKETEVIDELYRKTIVNNNDGNPTYKIASTYDDTLGPISIEEHHYPGINGLNGEGLGDDTTYTAYFIPNQLYKLNGSQYELMAEYENTTFYKNRSVIVKSDPLGEFNEGEVWNTKLDINEINNARPAGKELVLGLKNATPHLYELESYSRKTNTINGWILYLNRLLGVPGDLNTRDRTTIQGLINYLNDRLDKIENVGKNQLLISDKYGHINGATLDNATSQWVEATITHTSTIPTFTLSHKTNDFASVATNHNAFGATLVGNDIQFTFPTIDDAGHVVGKTNPTAESGATAFTLPFGYKTISGTTGTATASNTADTIAITGDSWLSTAASTNSLVISHIGPVTVTARSESDVTPSFGDTFTIEDWAFDEKGHKSALSTHTVSIPKGSLTTSIGVSGDVITDLAFTDTTGALVISGRSNIGALTLSGYTVGTSTAAVEATDTLNAAISKLQKQIDAHVSADEITSFSTTTATSASNVVASLTLSNGNLAATTISANDLLLTGYMLASEPSAAQIGIYESPVAETDPIGQAFAKLQYQVNSLNTSINDLSDDDIQNQLNLDNNTNKNTSGIKFFAHRGLTPTGIVENTIPAFIEGYKKGYRCFETDVRVSQDSVPILNHNDNINSAIIADTNYEALAAQATALGYTLATLNDYLKFVNILNIEYTVLEIKSENTVEGCAIIASLVKRYQLTDRIIFNVKGNTAYADAIREVLPKAILLTHYDSSTKETFSAYKTTGKVIFSIVPSEDIGSVITQAEMERLHADGYGIYLVPTSSTELTTCINMGFPYIEVGEAIKNTLNLSQAIYDSIGVNLSPWEARIGEVITLGQQVCAGQMTSDGVNLWFSIISPKMIPEGATVTFSGNVNIKHPQGEIAHATEINSIGTLTVENISGNQIYIKIVLDPASTFTDDTPLTLQLGSGFQMSIIQQ